MKNLSSILLLCLLAFSCSEEETSNNGKTNNTTSQTTQTNGTASTNNGTTTNAKTTNGSTGSTTQTTPLPDAHDFTCAPFTAEGELDIVAGDWDIKDLCFFENPFGAFNRFCSDLIFTDFNVTQTEGKVIVDLPYFALVDFSKVEVDIFIPKACAEKLGQGTCEGTKARIDSLISADVVCVDANAADCECTIKGEFGTRRTGTLEFLSSGKLKTWEFDDMGRVVEDQIQFALQAQKGVFATGKNMDILEVEKGTPSTSCEKYCMTFLAACNKSPDVDAYTGLADCMTQCATFSESGMISADDTLECRLDEARKGADGNDPTNFATHCPNAQKNPTDVCTQK